MTPRSRTAIGGEMDLDPLTQTESDEANEVLEQEGHVPTHRAETEASKVAVHKRQGQVRSQFLQAGVLSAASLPPGTRRIVSGTTHSGSDEYILVGPGVAVPVSEF